MLTKDQITHAQSVGTVSTSNNTDVSGDNEYNQWKASLGGDTAQSQQPKQVQGQPETFDTRLQKASDFMGSIFPGQKLGNAIGSDIAGGISYLRGDSAKASQSVLPTYKETGQALGDTANAMFTAGTSALPGSSTYKGALGTGMALGTGQNVASQLSDTGNLSKVDVGKALGTGAVSSMLFGMGHGIGHLTNYMTEEGANNLMKSAIAESPKEIAKEVNEQAPILSQQLLAHGISGSENAMLSHSYAALNTTEKALQTEAAKYANTGNEGLTSSLVGNITDALKEQGFSKTAEDIANMTKNSTPEKLVANIIKAIGDKSKNPAIKSILNSSLSDIQQVSQSRAVNSIPTKSIASGLNSVIKTANNVPGNKTAVSELSRIQASILQRGAKMSIPDALQLKRDIYHAIGSRGFNIDAKLSASNEGLRNVASSIATEIGKISPEMAKLTEQQQMWLRLSDALENKVSRSGGKDVLGLKDTILAAGGDFKGVGTSVGRKVMETTRVKSNIAQGLNKLGNVKAPSVSGLTKEGTIKTVNAMSQTGTQDQLSPQ